MTESSRGEHLVDILIAIAKSEYAQGWSRYGELAQKLAQEAGEKAIELSAEDCARRLLVGHYSGVLGHGLTAGMLSQLLGGDPSEFQQTTWEATRLEQIFRDRMLSLFQAGEYSLTGFDQDLRPISIPPELIDPELLRFDSDKIQMGNKLIMHVRATRDLPQNSNPPTPGPKPGQATQKDRVFDAARAILDDDAKRPPKGRGRLVRIVQMVQESYLPAGIGIRYKLNTIERMIRPAFKEWEKRNPDK
ncbi:MAG: hypothetical protein P4M05_15500 [Bradyrhizobium sp.]|nr:hypothetical protein [Bradyrhizobium sp.]